VRGRVSCRRIVATVLLLCALACSRGTPQGTTRPVGTCRNSTVPTATTTTRESRPLQEGKDRLENSPPPNDVQASKALEMNKHVARMLQTVKTWEKVRPLPIPVEQLPEKVYAEMAGWAHEIFKEGCPLVALPETYRVILASDETKDDAVVRDFLLGERKGTLYETEGQIMLLAPSTTNEATELDELYAAVHEFSKTCLAANLTWRLRPRCEIEGPNALSSSPYQTIWTGPFWYSRVDAGTFDSRLFVLLYKRIGQRFGLGGGAWFDNEFRLRVAKSAQRTK
jgi:hypothetical protein